MGTIKNKLSKLWFVLVVLSMGIVVFSSNQFFTKAEEVEPTENDTFILNGGEYSLNHIMRYYNVFSFGKTTSMHINGAILTKEDAFRLQSLDENTGAYTPLDPRSTSIAFFDHVGLPTSLQQSRSYIGGVASVSNISIPTVLYVGSDKNPNIASNIDQARVIKNDNYIDWSTAKRNLKQESINLWKAAQEGENQGILERKIDPTGHGYFEVKPGQNVIIKKEHIQNGDYVFFKSGNSFYDTELTIVNYEGKGEFRELEVKYGSAIESAKFADEHGWFPGYGKTPGTYSSQAANNERDIYSLNYISNFPEATKVLKSNGSSSSNVGHIIAVDATYVNRAGNINGSIIVGELLSTSEIHAWPLLASIPESFSKVEFTAIKEWVGGPEAHPAIDLQLYQNGKAWGEPVTLENGTLEYTWKDLPEKDDKGNFFEYSVDEVATPENYTKKISGEKITNTYVIPKTTFTVNKKWVNGPQDKPTIEVQLYRDGEIFGNAVKLKNGTTNYTWTDLPDTDERGNKYVYTVKEVNDPVNYESSVEGSTITNTYIVPKTEFTVNKEWRALSTNHPAIEVQLYQDGEVYGEPVILESGITSYTWSDLPETKLNGETYTYTVDEINVPENYLKEVQGSKIINTRAIEFTVTKEWINGPDLKPTISIQLYQDGTPFGDEIDLNDGETTYTWTQLPEVNEEGNIHVYTVEEVSNLENYESKVEGSVITNTFIVESIDFTMTKEWVNGPNTKPTINVQLLRDGVPYAETAELSNGMTSYTWYDLPKTDNKGKLYVYSLQELDVPENYSVAIDGTKVTNTYVVPKTEYTATKKWVDGPVEKPSIEIQLYQDGKVYGDSITLLDGELKYTWNQLPKTDLAGNEHIYTVDEITSLEDYTKEVNGNTITNTFIIEETDFTVTKNWVNGPKIKPTIEVQLYQNDKPFGAPISLEDGTLEYTWKHLPKTAKDGTLHTYTVKEVNVPENFEATYEDNKITNTYVIPMVEYSATKKWVNGPETKPTIELQLYQDGIAYGVPVSLEDGTLEHTWSNLPATDTQGNLHIYSVDELTVLDDYSKEVKGNTITNSFKIETTEYTVTKEWINGPQVKPTIEVQLYQDGKAFGDVVALENGLENYTWTDLPLTDTKGNTHVYTVDEITVLEDYSKEVTGNTITNTFIVEETDYTVTKQWVNGPDVKPKIEVQLYQNGEVYGTPKTLADGETSYTWTNLPKTDLEGHEYNYTVDELTVLDDYSKEVKGNTITNTYQVESRSYKVTKEWIGGPKVKPTIEVQLYQDGKKFGDPVQLKEGVLEYVWNNLPSTDLRGKSHTYTVDEVTEFSNYIKTVDGTKITNRYVSPETEFTITKEWVNGPKTKPEIEVQLYRNSEAYGDSIFLKDGQTSYTWDKLPETDNEGNVYFYTVDEVTELENYSKEVNGNSIVNTYIIPKTNYTVTKEWVGGPADKESIEIQLYQDGVAYGNSITLNNGSLSYTWSDLPKTDVEGKEYDYTVNELTELQGYTTLVQDNKIINTYNDGKLVIEGTKTWVGGPKLKPTINVNLYRNDLLLDSVQLKNGKLDYSFKELMEYDENGNLYTYHIEEEFLDKNIEQQYSSEVNEYNLTNTFIAKRDITVDKKWIGNEQESITVVLTSNYDFVEKVNISKEDNWSYTFKNLDVYDEDGNEIIYSISELQDNRYITEVTGDMNQGFVITNTEIIVEVPPCPINPVCPEKPGGREPLEPKEPNNHKELPRTGLSQTLTYLGWGMLGLGSTSKIIFKKKKD